jgi:hypothetical protein
MGRTVNVKQEIPWDETIKTSSQVIHHHLAKAVAESHEQLRLVELRNRNLPLTKECDYSAATFGETAEDNYYFVRMIQKSDYNIHRHSYCFLFHKLKFLVLIVQ